MRRLNVARLLLVFASGAAILLVVCQRRNGQEMRRLHQIANAGTASGWPVYEHVESARQTAVQYARSMRGAPYDPLMGKYGDPLGKLGFVVCIDVPLRAYQAAGVSIDDLLARAAHEHADWFKIGPSNSSKNSFFYRRVRNYSDLFTNSPQLETAQTPEIGDWAFYGRFHIALVVEKFADGRFEVVEASPRRGRVVISDSAYMEKTWGNPSFFGRIRPLGDAHIGPVEMTPAFRKLFKANAGRR